MKYWVPEGRQTVQAIFQNYFICNLVKGKLVGPPKHQGYQILQLTVLMHSNVLG